MFGSENLLENAEIQSFLSQTSDWCFDNNRLQKQFSFSNFRDAMAFMSRVAFEAEELNHHPNWSNVYNRVDVQIWSHDLGGVSAKCLALANAMESAARSFSEKAGD